MLPRGSAKSSPGSRRNRSCSLGTEGFSWCASSARFNLKAGSHICHYSLNIFYCGYFLYSGEPRERWTP